jgi:nucleotide-binding universal stress UspA family protein
MYDTILVPLDGSKRAERILPHVEELAQRYGAKVVFLRVVEPPTVMTGPEGVSTGFYQGQFDQQAQEADSYLAARQGEFREKGIEVQKRVTYGSVVEAIIRVAEREKTDLIAMASHGRSGLSQVFYGSVAAGVLHRIDRPLLLIRSQDLG